jgi:hypothetical protein
MRRHVIIGRFGSRDRAVVPVADDEVRTSLNLLLEDGDLAHGIGRALADLAELSITPSEVGVDLLMVAAHVHAADTRVSRTTESQDSWTREIRLVVPVSNLPLWRRSTPVLQRMLDFLTGDRWTVGFRTRPAEYARIVTAKSGDAAGAIYDGLSLFSGGLDSLVGAIDLLEDRCTRLFISHAAEGATSDAQQSCFEGLRRHYQGCSLSRLRVWMNFPKNLVSGVASEMTMRGRSFLFFAIGAFAGSGLTRPFSLHAPENGLIAVNVPLDPLRVGALSTRTTHPFYMARWNDLLGILGIHGKVENPYWNKTKGEMLEACANEELLHELLPHSMSCSSPTKGRWRGHGIEHCGYCVPCLIRRAAIRHVLGRRVDPTTYSTGTFRGKTFDTRAAEGQAIRALHLATERLRSRPELADILIYKSGPLSDVPAQERSALAHVYGRGMEEVRSLIGNVRARPS